MGIDTYSYESVSKLMHAHSQALESEDFDLHLRMLTDDFRYRVSAYSPELRKEMVWLDHGSEDYRNMIRMLRQHVRVPGRFFRQVVVNAIKQQDDKVGVTSSFVVVYTNPDGESKLFAVGRYHDQLAMIDNDLRLASREVRLETRDLGPGMHVPI